MSGIVLGIDPGSITTGFGAVEERDGRLSYVDCGVVRTPSSAPFAERLALIYDGITEVIERLQPSAAAVESVFHARHASSALKLGQARGVALLAAIKAGLPLHEYPPARVKSAVAGSGRADKAQVKMMVETLMGQRIDAPEDATDALAVAICHLHASPLLDAMNAADAAARGGRRRRRR